MRANKPPENEPTVLELLPLRYPYLMVDRVLEREPARVVAVKNVSQNEWFFVGHFPGRPLMPGTLLIEGMAQTAGILMQQFSNHPQAQGLLVGVDGARFRRPVVPGDQVLYDAKLLKARGGLYRMEVAARVDGELVAEAVLSLMNTSE